MIYRASCIDFTNLFIVWFGRQADIDIGVHHAFERQLLLCLMLMPLLLPLVNAESTHFVVMKLMSCMNT